MGPGPEAEWIESTTCWGSEGKTVTRWETGESRGRNRVPVYLPIPSLRDDYLCSRDRSRGPAPVPTRPDPNPGLKVAVARHWRGRGADQASWPIGRHRQLLEAGLQLQREIAGVMPRLRQVAAVEP